MKDAEVKYLLTASHAGKSQLLRGRSVTANQNLGWHRSDPKSMDLPRLTRPERRVSL